MGYSLLSVSLLFDRVSVCDLCLSVTGLRIDE